MLRNGHVFDIGFAFPDHGAFAASLNFNRPGIALIFPATSAYPPMPLIILARGMQWMGRQQAEAADRQEASLRGIRDGWLKARAQF
jgi:hypothetical protein